MVNRIEHSFDKIVYEPTCKTIARVLLAHGAGAGNRHEFMESFATQLAEHGVEVHSFNFPYMQVAYEQDKRRPPNSNKQLVSYFQTLVETQDGNLPLFIGGKSMGGRISTQIMAEQKMVNQVLGAFVLGYPFMPPGKPEKLPERMKHFTDINNPVLILQGERDTFGNKKLIAQHQLPDNFSVEWLTSGDHSFKPLKSSGVTLEHNIACAVKYAVQFIQSMV